MHRWAAVGMIVLATTVLAACAGNAGPDSPAAADPAGTWGDTSMTSEPSLVLSADGKLTGTDGCNRLTGSWNADEHTGDHADGSPIAFADVASTRMMCQDVDTWLSNLATGTISGDTLTVFDKSGAEIGTLPRTE